MTAATRDEWLTFVVVGGVRPASRSPGSSRSSPATRMKQRLPADRLRAGAGDPARRRRARGAGVQRADVGQGRRRSSADLGVTVREHALVTGDRRPRGRRSRSASRPSGSRPAPWSGPPACTAAAWPARSRAPRAPRTDRAGRIEVNPDLTLPGHPEISVIGDAANLAGPDGKPLPGLATAAIQQARHVADAIQQGQPGASTPFKYFDKGALAVVGRGRAVCEVRGHRLSGLIAFLMYLRRAPVLPRRCRRAGESRSDHDVDRACSGPGRTG